MTYNNNLKCTAQSSTFIKVYYTRLEVLTALEHLSIYVLDPTVHIQEHKPSYQLLFVFFVH